MSDTTAGMRRKIAGAGDLQSVVRTMKAVAASSIGQYEKSVSALADFNRAVELGLGACFRESGPAPLTPERKAPGAIGAVVFGSDQGLVGQFNDVVADFAIKTLAALPGKHEVWAVGERVHERLADAGLPLRGLFPVPNSVKAITPLVGQILLGAEAREQRGEVAELHLFHNCPKSGAVYEPVNQRLLPLDEEWRRKLAAVPWPTGNLPEVIGWRHCDLAGIHQRISFRVDLPGVRRIARERKRQPPGGHATRRQEYRRIAGGPQSDISSFAPEWHRRGAVRRCLRLRSVDAERIKMKINSKDFRVRPGEKVKLSEWPTIVKPFCKSKKEYQKLLGEHVEELSSLQRLHYASNRYALLLIFQGMDAAGKDGAIRHVMSGVNPQGCQVFSFKQPSADELEHDFLWRTTCRLPERGRIGIFNRSYYEEVLVVRVHPEILRSQGLSEELRDEKTIWEERYRSIVDLESHLYRNGTRTIKVFLHLSQEEQRKRFLERIDEPDKNWKFSLADIHERKYWKDYMKAYEACLSATSTDHAPWYAVPADDKENARLIVSQIVLDALNELKMAYPKTTAKRRRELKSIRKLLTK